MVFGKLVTALGLVLLVAAPGALATKSHVRIHIRNAATTSPNTTTEANAGSLFGQLEDLDPAQFKIATCAPQVWKVTRDKASALWLDFRSIQVSGGDQLIVSALDGSRAQVFNSTLKNGISTMPIPGKSLRLEFRPSNDTSASESGCASSKKLPSFTIEKLGVGFPSSQFVTKEKICGKEQLVNAQCLQQELKNQSDAVMRLLIEKDGNGYWCSAWLWGNQGHIITNHHCISSQIHVDKTQFQFKVETPGCEDKKCSPHKCPVGEILYGKDNVDFIRANKALDFAILKISANLAAKFVAKYGYLRFRKGEAKPNETFFLVQHPHGGPKVIPAILNTREADTLIPNLSALFRSTSKTSTIVNALGYMADTEGGSSGSPLIADEDRLVIGLHHLGGCPNKAVASNQLASALSGQFKDIDGFA